MKSKVYLSLDVCCDIEGLCDEYELLFGTAVPDSVFFEMIVDLGLDAMRDLLTQKSNVNCGGSFYAE